VKIFAVILVLFFSASTFAEVVEVPPVRQPPNNGNNGGVEEFVGSSGEWQSMPLERKQTIKKSRPAPSANCQPSYPVPAPPSATSLYGDPTRGFVHNRSNFFLRCWWASSNGKPDAKPNFEIAPGFVWEGNLQPGGYKWLYIEAIAATGKGMFRVGWKTFEIYPYNQPLISGWYGWQVYVNSGDFPYFTGNAPVDLNWKIP